MLIAIGLLAMATVVTGSSVDLVRYFGLALTIIGVGLLIGTWYGHARLMILLGFLLLPFAIAASLIHVPFEGGFGSLEAPTGQRRRPRCRVPPRRRADLPGPHADRGRR